MIEEVGIFSSLVVVVVAVTDVVVFRAGVCSRSRMVV